MAQRHMVTRALIGTALACLALAETSRTQQPPPASSRASPARSRAQSREVFLKACGRCHPPERVTATRRTKAQWEETIEAMVNSRGATLTDEEHDVVLTYLAQEHGPTTTRAGRTSQPTGGPRAGTTAPVRPRGGAGAEDKHIVDAAAAARGRKTYAAACIQCHGTQARGTERGANLVRSLVVLRDRYGSELGPFLRKGHALQDGGPSLTYTDARVSDLSHFLHERLNDTLRGSPVFKVQNVLTGDRKSGEAYFNGEGGCHQCHSPTGDLAGIGGRYDPPTIQQRVLFPRPPARGTRGASPAAGKAVTATVTGPSGEQASGVLVHIDDFNVSIRDADGTYRSWKRIAGLSVVKNDPYAAHIALLDKYTDQNMHDVVAYLESLK
jgi:cytochrome c oxidase cbb3-type subunit 3